MESLGEYVADEAQVRDHSDDVAKHAVTDTIKVSSTAHSVFFYVDLATKFLVDHDQIHISGLGKTVTVVVTLAEILKKEGIANVIGIQTSLVPVPPEQRKPGAGKTNKSKIDLIITKAPTYFEYLQKKRQINEDNKIVREKLEAARQRTQIKLKQEAESTA